MLNKSEKSYQQNIKFLSLLIIQIRDDLKMLSMFSDHWVASTDILLIEYILNIQLNKYSKKY